MNPLLRRGSMGIKPFIPAPVAADVFSATAYTGNGTSQSINNSIDLSTYGGLVWTKARNNGNWHTLQDTVGTGLSNYLVSLVAWGYSADSTRITAWNSNGYSVGANGDINGNTNTYASWTFRKARRFFDIVSYSSSGNQNHNLGVTPGLILIKTTADGNSNIFDWVAYHRSLPANSYIKLNSTGGYATNSNIIVGANSSYFTVGTNAEVTYGGNAIAYVFAHDTGDGSIIKCDTFNNSGSTINIDCGFSSTARFVMFKSANPSSDWYCWDSTRGYSGSPDHILTWNGSAAESTGSDFIDTYASGFTVNGANFGLDDYIYMAIQ